MHDEEEKLVGNCTKRKACGSTLSARFTPTTRNFTASTYINRSEIEETRIKREALKCEHCVMACVCVCVITGSLNTHITTCCKDRGWVGKMLRECNLYTHPLASVSQAKLRLGPVGKEMETQERMRVSIFINSRSTRRRYRSPLDL